MKIFVDTNLFMRFFTRDDEGQHAIAASLFREAASGGLELITGPPVLFEIAWTLRSAYHVPREKILDAMARIIAFPSLELTDRELVERAVELAREKGAHFADAYIVASAEVAGVDSIATFNVRDFAKLGAKVYRR